MINFYIVSKRFFLKRKELFDALVVSIIKKEYGSTVEKIHKVFKVNIWWIIKCNLLKLSFIWNFHNKIVSTIYSNIFFHSKIRLCNKTQEICLVFCLLKIIQLLLDQLLLNAINVFIFCLNCILHYFHKYYPYLLNIQ